MLTAYQADVRAFYYKLYPVASGCTNDCLLVLGLISTISLPSIGYFDEHTYGNIHNVLAVLFFGSVGLYAFIISNVMSSNKDLFPQDQWAEIDRMARFKWIMMASLLALALSGTVGVGTWTFPFFEWVTMLLYVNYFSILSMTNSFYDTVHEESTQLSKGVKQIQN